MGARDGLRLGGDAGGVPQTETLKPQVREFRLERRASCLELRAEAGANPVEDSGFRWILHASPDFSRFPPALWGLWDAPGSLGCRGGQGPVPVLSAPAMFCLKVPTDSQWVDEALRDLGALLVDHAHCELKAASNALSLAARHPTRFALVRALSDLAREEVDHFQQVLHLLEARGLPLGEPRTDTYAAALRYAASRLPRDAAIPALVDRLLVAAVIEARSCERFKLLMTALEAADAPEIFALYQDLFPSEARHYRTFYDLAVEEAGGDEARVRGRLDALAEAEARIVAGLATEEQRSTVHG